MKSSEKMIEVEKETKEKTTRGRKKDQKEITNDVDVNSTKVESKKKKHMVSKKIIFQSILIILGIAIGMFVYHQFFANSAEKDQEKLLSSLSEIMILPQEEATIFDIDDPELLTKDQDFFVGSMKGDKLVVFPVAGKAIIYRPEDHLIVNVGPVLFDEKVNAGN